MSLSMTIQLGAPQSRRYQTQRPQPGSDTRLGFLRLDDLDIGISYPRNLDIGISYPKNLYAGVSYFMNQRVVCSHGSLHVGGKLLGAPVLCYTLVGQSPCSCLSRQYRLSTVGQSYLFSPYGRQGRRQGTPWVSTVVAVILEE